MAFSTFQERALASRHGLRRDSDPRYDVRSQEYQDLMFFNLNNVLLGLDSRRGSRQPTNPRDQFYGGYVLGNCSLSNLTGL